MGRIKRVYGLRLIRAAVLGLLAALICFGTAYYLAETAPRTIEVPAPEGMFDKYDLDPGPPEMTLVEIESNRERVGSLGGSFITMVLLVYLTLGGVIALYYHVPLPYRKWAIIALLLAAFTFFVNFLGNAFIKFDGPHSTPNDDLAFPLFGLSFLLPLLFALAPPAIVYGLERLQENPTYRRWFIYGRGGSARWAGPATYDRLSVNMEGAGLFESNLQTDRIFLGRTLFDDDPQMRLVGIKDDAHMLTIGMTGSGKSLTVLYPNLAMYKGSVIALDPKGELALQTYSRRSSTEWLEVQGVRDARTEKHFPQGRCFVLDPFNETKGALPRSASNPLLEVDIKSERAREMISAISDGCILDEGDRNRHFSENAKLFFEGVLAHVLSEFPKEKHNLPFLLDLFIGINEEGMADPGALKELIIDMRTNPACGKLPQHAAATLDGMGDREKGSVLSTLARSLKWVGDPAMRQHLTRSDFSFKDICNSGKVPDTVYIVLPFGLIESQMRWLRVLVGVSIVALRNREAPPDPPTLFVLDEFPRLGGKIEAVESGVVTLRSAKVKLWPFIQSISQLEHDYPTSWRVFTGSSNVQIFGVSHGDSYTADWISEALGRSLNIERKGRIFRRRIIHSSTDPLYTAAEVANELGKQAPLQIVLPVSGFPMRLERLSYKAIKGLDFPTYEKWSGHFADH